MRQWYYLHRMKSQTNWDRRSGCWPYMTIWSIVVVNSACVIFPFPNYPQHSCNTITSTSPSSRLAHCSSLPVYVNQCMPRVVPLLTPLMPPKLGCHPQHDTKGVGTKICKCSFEINMKSTSAQIIPM
jgi:hypothetical protein